MTEINLYDYQTRAVEALRENIRDGIKNQILCAPTGSGKTVMAAYLTRAALERGSRVVFLADRKPLILQTSETFDRFGIDHGVIQAQHWRYRPWKAVQVASPQTLERREWPEGLDLIIVDEAHTARKNTLARIQRRDCVTIGLTATPFTRGLGKHYDAVVSVTTTNELIQSGNLAPYRIFAPSEPDMTGAKVTAGEWTDRDAAERSMPIVGDVVEHYLKLAYGRKFIAFGATVAHAQAIRDQFLASGVRAEMYVGTTTDEERAGLLDEYRKRDSQILGLCSVGALAKGFDVEDVSCVIVARPLRKSLAEHVQIIGRGLRRDPHDPDKECIVLDHAGNTMRLGDQMAEFFEVSVHELDDGKTKDKKKKERPKEERHRKCPTCHHVHAVRPSCPNCGYEYPRKQVLHQSGELVERGSSAGVPKGEKQRWYSELIGYAQARGYKSGWASHKYREKFGVWPRSLSETPAPVTAEVERWIRSRMIAWAKAKKRRAG
jgi:DNA repair protein RadD